jgi:hypothetical protein
MSTEKDGQKSIEDLFIIKSDGSVYVKGKFLRKVVKWLLLLIVSLIFSIFANPDSLNKLISMYSSVQLAQKNTR